MAAEATPIELFFALLGANSRFVIRPASLFTAQFAAQPKKVVKEIKLSV